MKPMKPFAVAMSAYNPQRVPSPNSHINVSPLGNPRPLNCQIVVLMSENDAGAEKQATEHCKKMFPERLGWRDHTVAVLDINRSLMTP